MLVGGMTGRRGPVCQAAPPVWFGAAATTRWREAADWGYFVLWVMTDGTPDLSGVTQFVITGIICECSLAPSD